MKIMAIPTILFFLGIFFIIKGGDTVWNKLAFWMLVVSVIWAMCDLFSTKPS